MSEKKISLLVLEDSTTQAKMISRMFCEEGASAEVITSARDFTSSPHLFELKIDAALIDVHFGEVSGLSLIDPIARRWPGVSLVMMTANNTNDFSVLADARERGAHLVLRKPFSMDDVRAVLADIKSIQKTGKRRKHVVVIDDSKTTCRIVTEVLKAYGFRVSSFQNGLDAIQQLSFDHVDAVLTDMCMPGMSGDELICLVRDVWKNVGIVAMSGDMSSHSGGVKADAFIPKPFGPEELISVIRQVTETEYLELAC
jgi:DNA-binding NtrC family response regulator